MSSKEDDHAAVVCSLKELSEMTLDLDELVSRRLPDLVRGLRKHEVVSVAAEAKKLRAKWMEVRRPLCS